MLLDVSDGVPARCAVNTDVLLTIPKSLLGHRITALTQDKVKLLDLALRFSLDL